MATLGIITDCGAGGGNTGLPSCQWNPDLIIGSLKIPKGTVLTAAQLVDLEATIQALLVHDTYASRAHRFGRFEEIDDQSEDRAQKTWGYGGKTTTREETYDWVFYYTDGGFCTHQAYKRFSGRHREYDELFIDQSGHLIGRKALDANGVYGLAGIQLKEFYVKNWKPSNGSDPAMYACNYKAADAKQLNEQLVSIEMDFDIFALDTIKDIDLQPVGTTIVDADGDINVSVTSGCGGQNLVELYGATIANAARFAVTNASTGVAIAFAVASGGSGDSAYVAFNVDDTDAAYPSAGGHIKIETVAVSTVHTAVGEYYESNELILEVL
jgi:hypothetical protein